MVTCRIIVTGLLLTLGGCATTTPTVAYLSANPPDPDQLLSGAALLGETAATLQMPSEDILATSQEMLEYMDAVGSRGGSKERRATFLATSLVDPRYLGLEYVAEESYSAAETFRKRRGNCMSFTNLFVSLARSTGLTASFQQAYVVPKWVAREDVAILHRHVNARVSLPAGAYLTVDFEQTIEGTRFDSRRLSDAHARALYYGNIGVEYMLDDNTQEAFRYLAGAVQTEPSVGSSWVNLGALYSRNELPDYAEAAYLESVRRDPDELLAYSNLARLYKEKGLQEQQELFALKARTLQNQNPFHHFSLAQQAHDEGNYQLSNHHLRRAMRLKNDEPRFRALMQENKRLLEAEMQGRS